MVTHDDLVHYGGIGYDDRTLRKVMLLDCCGISLRKVGGRSKEWRSDQLVSRLWSLTLRRITRWT